MATQQELLERLKRVASHYAGVEDVSALEKTEEFQAVYRQKLSECGDNEDLAFDATISALSVLKEPNSNVNGWYLDNVTFTNEEGKQESRARVLLEGGQTRTVGSPQNWSFGAPCIVNGVDVTRNIAASTVTYRMKESAILQPGGHQGAIQHTALAPILAQASTRKRKGSSLIGGRAYGAFVCGTVINEQGNGIYIAQGEEGRPASLSIPIQCADRQIQARVSAEWFHRQTGIDPVSDVDFTKETLAGRTVYAIGTIEVLARLNDAMEKENRSELERVLTQHCETGLTNKVSLTEPVAIASGITIQNVFNTRDGGVAFQALCNELGYSPSITPEPKTFGEGEDAETYGQNNNIWFDGLSPGKPVVSPKFEGMSALRRTKLA